MALSLKNPISLVSAFIWLGSPPRRTAISLNQNCPLVITQCLMEENKCLHMRIHTHRVYACIVIRLDPHENQ